MKTQSIDEFRVKQNLEGQQVYIDGYCDGLEGWTTSVAINGAPTLILIHDPAKQLGIVDKPIKLNNIAKYRVRGKAQNNPWPYVEITLTD